MRATVFLCSLALMFSLPLSVQAADEWGDLSGTFVLDGPIPKPVPADITKDKEFCGKHNVVDESLVIGKTGGVKNIMVYMYLREDDPRPAVHPSYEKTAKDKVRLDNMKCRFEPHVVLLRTTQTLVLGNKDSLGHNTKADCLANLPFNDLIPGDAELEKKLTEVEKYPVGVSCSIHGWMKAWILVKDNPYFAVTDENGNFTIKNIPAGDWTFQFRHERAGYIRDVTIDGKQDNWTLGKVDVKVTPGGTVDLGTVKLAPSVFAD